MSEGVRLYAGTQHGLIIWRSTNGGWEQVARHFEDGIIDSIFGCKQSPERVFVGVTHDGLYRTVNGGKSWVKILDGDIRSVTVDPTNDRVIYSGVEPVALYRSEDGGDHWQELKALKELPEAVRKNWRFPQPPHLGHVRHIFIHPDNPDIIYLCLEHGGIVRSFDRYYLATARGSLPPRIPPAVGCALKMGSRVITSTTLSSCRRSNRKRTRRCSSPPRTARPVSGAARTAGRGRRCSRAPTVREHGRASRTGSRTISIRWSGHWCIIRRTIARSSPASAMSRAATPPGRAAPVIS
jgi:hypothetical protein